MKVRWLPVLITVWLVLLGATGAQASSPALPGAIGIQANGSTFTYQGFLSLNGQKAQGQFDFSFSLFAGASGGSALAGPLQFNDISVNQGLFTVQLDFGASVFDGQPRYLSIGVRPGSSSGAYTTLSPRQPLTAAPYAVYAQNIPLAGSGFSSSAARSDHDHFGARWFGTAFDGLFISNDSAQQAATAIFGYATASNPGPNVTGVLGISEGTGATGIGVYGYQAGQGWGVAGYTRSGLGVYGYTDQGNGADGSIHAVLGWSDSFNGRGVSGVAKTGPNSIGVVGESVDGYAGFFFGKVHVTGQLTSNGTQLKIDHPLDPANKYLQHSSVESPDMKNVYDGVVTLGANGSAVVQLPDWFEALNKDFRYQLTAIGAPGPNLYVAQEIRDNRFTIAGGKAGMKVSWQVTGIRHDPYAEQNRTQPEVLKPANEQGTYLYPQGYGQPASLETHHQPSQQPAQQRPFVPR